MITILFWNVGGEARRAEIAQLAVNHDVDVVLLSEVIDEPSSVLLALNESSVSYSYSPGIGNKRIHVFARFSETFVAPVFETDRLTIRRLHPPGMEEILLAAVHFPSKHDWSEDSQAMECTTLAEGIRQAENTAGHQRTVLVGDLNMNPFETGVVGAAGLHAVMDRRVAQRVTRVVQGREYSFFYNPMWGLFGDGSRGPAGTFFHSRSEQKVFFWNMFDQVLIRPALLDCFRMDDLAIIDHTGDQSLLTASGIPDRSAGSDHLPILFRMSL